MFGLIDDVVDFAGDVAEGTVNTVDSILSGEAPSKKQVLNMLEAGMTIYTIADLTGLSIEAIRSLQE